MIMNRAGETCAIHECAPLPAIHHLDDIGWVISGGR
jgi:hypothetical protein